VADSTASKPFDPFELAVALLLGIGAIATAVASHQSGLWGGASVEGYGAAAAMTTEASSTYNDELTTYMQDAMIDNRAKEMVWEAFEIGNEDRAARLKAMASWLYTSQLSEPAYKTLKLPPAEEAVGEDEITLPDEALDVALNTDLDDAYVDTLFTPSSEQFEAAKKRFDEARAANEMGDKFSLAGVILTIALFFSGLALVFKTRMRWGFLASGAVVLVGGIGYMSTLTWA
jgi:hypothetical protein